MSSSWCQILKDCHVEVGAGDSMKSENKCSDSKVERNDWSDGGILVFKILEVVCLCPVNSHLYWLWPELK